MDDKRKLKGMLARIFSDGDASNSERAELEAYLASGALTVLDVREVLVDFVQTTWKITMADGVLSDVERKRLNEIVVVLGLELESLPEEWIKTLRGSAAVEWILLRSFTDRSQASQFGEFLEQAGIKPSVEGAFAAGLLPGVEGVRVMVPADRIADAREAAEAFDGNAKDRTTPTPHES